MTTKNNIHFLSGLLFAVIAAIILQLDAYFYLSGLYSIKPWIIVLSVFVLLGFSRIVSYGLPSWKNFSVRHDVLILLLCVLIYVLIQVSGISSWTTLPDEKILYWFWVYMLVLVFLGMMTGRELKQKSTDFFFWVLVAHVVILLIDNVWGGISETSLWARASGTLRNPNNAAFLSVALLVGSIRWYQVQPGLKEFTALVLTVLAIGLTGSRGGALSLFIVLSVFLFYWISTSRIKRRKIQRLVIGGVVIMFIMSMTLLAIYELRYVKRANMKNLQEASVVNLESHKSASVADIMDPNDRDNAMEIALGLIGDRPWLGHGTGYVYTQEEGPHNMLLRSLVEVGIPGLLGYLILFTGLMWFARYRQDWGLAALILCGFTEGLVAHTITENRSYLVIVGIMLWVNSSRRSM